MHQETARGIALSRSGTAPLPRPTPTLPSLGPDETASELRELKTEVAKAAECRGAFGNEDDIVSVGESLAIAAPDFSDESLDSIPHHRPTHLAAGRNPHSRFTRVGVNDRQQIAEMDPPPSLLHQQILVPLS